MKVYERFWTSSIEPIDRFINSFYFLALGVTSNVAFFVLIFTSSALRRLKAS
jgi:hypothetical protein